MLPQSQLILLVILIVLALILLNWEAGKSPAASDELGDEAPPVESNRPTQDHGKLSPEA